MFSRPTVIPYYKNILDGMFDEWREKRQEKAGRRSNLSSDPVITEFLIEVQENYYRK